MGSAGPLIRPAEKAEAPALARLIDIAGEGIPAHLWSAAVVGGETALEVGRRRAEREEGGFSYRNAHVAEIDGAVAGLLLGYRQPDPYETGDLAGLPDLVRPLVELEAMAPGSWYINALAVLPEHRGRGIGSCLLGEADRLARRSGAERLSIIVASENIGAYRLYRRVGYRDVARRVLVGFPGFPHRGDWILLTKPTG